MKKGLILIFIFFLSFVLVSCTKNDNTNTSNDLDDVITSDDTDPNKDDTNNDNSDNTGENQEKPDDKEHVHVASDWIYPDKWECGDDVTIYKVCTICGERLDEEVVFMDHIFIEEKVDPTCTTDGYILTTCENCNFKSKKTLYATGHEKSDYITMQDATDSEPGIRVQYCTKCHEILNEYEYVNNGYHKHGKLSVIGTDLVDEYGKLTQLYGLSYHGLQWFNRYVNEDTILALQSYFGINVLRLACYPSEGGYAEGGLSMQQKYKECVDIAIKAGAKYGLYVVVDWHMVGADVPGDKNPLYYMDYAKEFLEYVASNYKDYDNVIYEIMNEPCGDTTWEDCKTYANTIIPIIRKYTDAVILVGNPHWSSDLRSVINDPLDYDNIMYTYHFYADDIKSPSEVIYAYSKGIPVFISEFGFMDSDGDGAMNYTSGENWLKALDERGISYIAWNISNSKGSASIISNSSSTRTNFSDKNLKEWGIYLKGLYRTKAGLS